MPDALPLRLPLLAMPDNRDTTSTKDAKLVNGYVEKVGERDYWIFKRPGLTQFHSFGPGVGRGLYLWKDHLYSVFGDTLLKDFTPLMTVSNAGLYSFTQTQGVPDYLFMQNGLAAYVYDGTTVTQVASNYPAITCYGSCFLDSTLYVMDPQSNIWGSDLNNPLSWDALNVIQARAEPDIAVALAKQLVYVVALKTWSTQFFYDAANAVGSPLLPVPAANIPYGCANGYSLQDIDGTLFWLSRNRSSAVQVIACNALKPTVISTKPVERLLSTADLTDMRSWYRKNRGHIMYGLTIPASNLTLVYDLSENIWSQWTDSQGNFLPIAAAIYTYTLEHYIQHTSNGTTYTMDQEFLTDDGSIITLDLVTPNFDAGTRYTKYLSTMEFIADQVPGSSLQVRYSDDDYQTWSNFRSVPLGNRRPMLTDCGSFRRRAWNLRHHAATRFRLQAVDLSLLLGTV